MVAEYLKEKQQYLAEYAEYVNIIQSLSWTQHQDKLVELVERRGIPMEILKEHGVFYIMTYQELMVPQFIDRLESFGLINELNHMPIFHERWIIPIKDFDGNIINLVGYSPDVENRYLYGTAKYYDRKNDMFGMENYKAAYELGWAVYVEGITDCMALRSLGYKNVFASCGTMNSDLKMRHLNQLNHGIIFIKDRDRAGESTKHWRVNCCVYLAISIETRFKDIDDYINKDFNPDTGEKYILGPMSTIRMERAENIVLTLEAAVSWLKLQGEHSKTILKDIRYTNITLV